MKQILSAIIAVATLLAASVQPPDAAEKVRIAITNLNMSFLPAGVALKRGFFRDEGLDVEIIRMNTPTTVAALMTGDIGYTLLFGSVVLTKDVPVSEVVDLGPLREAQKELGIK